MPDRVAGQAAIAPAVRPGAWAGADMAAFDAAYADMIAGCAFLIARGADRGRPVSLPVIAVRRACNCLKELDRFLVLMIDAANAAQGAPHGLRTMYVRDGDAAARLCRVKPLRGCFARDTPRLRAIGRIRALASGDAPAEIASRPRADLALATMGHDITEQADGAPFVLGDQTLAVIAAFYLSLADRLRALVSGNAPPG